MIFFTLSSFSSRRQACSESSHTLPGIEPRQRSFSGLNFTFETTSFAIRGDRSTDLSLYRLYVTVVRPDRAACEHLWPNSRLCSLLCGLLAPGADVGGEALTV